MTAGRFIAVVGPSGVGKDSVMRGIAGAAPHITLVTRVITRAPELGGEDFEPVSQAGFAQMRDTGAFCLHWGAHGLFYGIPQSTVLDVRNGQHRMANLSRGALTEAKPLFPNLTVLHVTASPKTLAARLEGRGREDPAEIQRRLERASIPLPGDIDVIDLPNDGPLAETVARAVRLLQADRA